ncbi:MAG: hypothetical protein AABZ00_18725 [Chloroflexota bacterium]|jgi:hypothetical protein
MSTKPVRRTYFGLFALIVAILAVAFIVANYVVAYLNISPAQFNQLNGFTAQFYCLLTPLAFGLGALGIIFKNDSKRLAWLALAVVTIPFLIIFVQFVLALVKYN